MKQVQEARKISQRLTWIIASISALLIIEVVFRLTGMALLIPTNTMNRVLSEDSEKIRILALGESTTAEYFAENSDGAWPRQVQRMLTRVGIPARVYNEGLGGTTTAFIVSRVPEFLEKYKPHIVISMMGINDSLSVRYDDGSMSSTLWLALLDLRLVKLMNWSIDVINSRFVAPNFDEEYLGPGFQPLLNAGVSLARSKSLADVERFFRGNVSQDRIVAMLLKDVGVKLGGDFRPGSNKKLSGSYVDRAYDLYPSNRNIVFWELNTLTGRLPNSRCVEVSRQLLQFGPNLSDELISMMAICFASDWRSDIGGIFRSRRVAVGRFSVPPTQYHYRILYDQVRKHGAALVAMQYPTLPVRDLMHYFSQAGNQIDDRYRDIIFVGNEENFRNALKSQSYESIFSDRFRGSWGHTTEKGHGLIAENLLPIITELVNSRFKERRW